MRNEMTYYDSRDGRRATTTRKGFSFFDWVMIAISALVAIGVILSWMARWIHPESYGFMAAGGIFAPVLFVANFMCLLYWVIRWSRGVYIPLAVFVAGLWGVTLFFRPSVTQSYADLSKDQSVFNVMTYNVRGMMRPTSGSQSRLRSSMNDVVAVIDSLKPHILCIQEFASTELHPASEFEHALPFFNYNIKRYNIDGKGQNQGWGNAIYSKFPIAASGHIDFEGTNNSILWADIALQRDTLRVFCAHLQTTAIKASDERYIVDMDFVADGTRTSRVKGILGSLTRNYIIRASQADTLANSIARSPHPVIVCGDFNDTPASWAYRRISRGLRDSFREAGKGYGYTYRGFFNLLRIDYMLHSRSFECVEYSSPSFANSDHNPVSVKLRPATN
jgi:endonuclease/exonuclease/phosphatase family metal-dependent hydrolase